MNVQEKLHILGGAARYDASCASSGSERKNIPGGLGNSVAGGICHSFADDGRCISLLKVLFTNACIFDCAYCNNRRSNDIARASFSVDELVQLTMGFYLRNYIEGLFLSSGVVRNADQSMENLVLVAKTLRLREKFNGYIHLKVIPGASQALIAEAGQYADRLSVNLELPSSASLLRLAPEKSAASVLQPMKFITGERQNAHELAVSQRNGLVPARSRSGFPTHKQIRFVPAGQSTQLIVGASPERDREILDLVSNLYKKFSLKRVYYSAYVALNADARLPAPGTAPPLLREHRLYQADWLMRFYGFTSHEILDDRNPDLDLELDPKAAYAIRHQEEFPVDLNRADGRSILRVPGIGPRSAERILMARKSATLREEDLRKLGVVLRRASPFLYFPGSGLRPQMRADDLRRFLLDRPRRYEDARQLDLFA